MQYHALGLALLNELQRMILCHGWKCVKDVAFSWHCRHCLYTVKKSIPMFIIHEYRLHGWLQSLKRFFRSLRYLFFYSAVTILLNLNFHMAIQRWKRLTLWEPQMVTLPLQLNAVAKLVHVPTCVRYDPLVQFPRWTWTEIKIDAQPSITDVWWYKTVISNLILSIASYVCQWEVCLPCRE